MLPVSLNGFLCVINDSSESIAHELGHEKRDAELLCIFVEQEALNECLCPIYEPSREC